MNRFAVIPTRNRHQELFKAVQDIADQVDLVIVIDNGSTPAVTTRDIPCGAIVIRDSEQPPNLSRLWNLGLDQARMLGDGSHKVAVLNDDTRVPAGWFDAVAEATDRIGAAAGCSSPWPPLRQELVKVRPDRDIMNRMTGWAFMLRNTTLRADERLRWWWGDTDLDWKARAAGGMVVIPGFTVENTLANTSTVGVLAEQAGRDRLTFQEIWGHVPW